MMKPNGERQLQNYRSARAAHDSRTEWVDSLPMVLLIESVKNCPLTCAMCSVPKLPVEHISWELLESLEPYHRYFGQVAIHGAGEPLLTDKLDYFVGISERYGSSLHTDTTGFFLSPRVIGLLCEAHLSVTFSIHAGTEKTYRKIMDQDLATVAGRIKELVSAAKHSGRRSTFKTSFLVLKENVDEIPEFLDLTAELGVKNARFMKLNTNALIADDSTDAIRSEFPFRYGEQFNQDVLDVFHARLPEYRERAERLGIKLHRGSFPEHASPAVERANFSGCAAPWMGELNLYQSGDLTLCCGIRNAERLGNLHEDSMEDMWNGESVRRFRRAFSEDRKPAICGSCKGLAWSSYEGVLERAFSPSVQSGD